MERTVPMSACWLEPFPIDEIDRRPSIHEMGSVHGSTAARLKAKLADSGRPECHQGRVSDPFAVLVGVDCVTIEPARMLSGRTDELRPGSSRVEIHAGSSDSSSWSLTP